MSIRKRAKKGKGNEEKEREWSGKKSPEWERPWRNHSACSVQMSERERERKNCQLHLSHISGLKNFLAEKKENLFLAKLWHR